MSDMTDIDHEKPTFFELIAQEQVNDLLGPVIRYVTSIYAQRHPRYFLKILNHHDELFAISMLFIQRYYLRNWGASFAENFYGLRRQKLRKQRPVEIPHSVGQGKSSFHTERLVKRDIRLSLIFLVFTPYIRTKANELNERLTGGGSGASNLLEDDFDPLVRHINLDSELDDSFLKVFKNRFYKFFKVAYPYVNAIDELFRLIYSLRYLFDKTPYWRSALALIGIELRRVTANQQNRMRMRFNSRQPSILSRDSLTGDRPGLFLIISRILRLLITQTFESLKIVLPCSIFFFKFLEWWYSSSNTSRYRRLVEGSDKDRLQLIKPPKILKPKIEGVLGDNSGKILPIIKGNCPVCRMKLANSTALPSGWVCCYKCAHSYVSKFQRCPVTFYPSSLADLRKIIG
ncbi:Pex12 amino terminal region-domain-containing protein [Phakopsora pachyrhizi]|uniref:Peroxisome assembly protein 12 n=1 Tax=Phakopsora pachyrhizi TaxID=170000 RepID=A0AAV0BN69_PHAPC|nr:Pex12 amino terminal region-domain-containing protein [Phakopsora pachyrhizi]CAH7687945.1 Pex12 amino terminal region-domain-containing protein [Phakopsora pachyrhizi]